MQKVPYLSAIVPMIQYRAARALVNGHVHVFNKLDEIQKQMIALVEEGGDGQTNGQDAGG